jgi:hypothetical protein
MVCTALGYKTSTTGATEIAKITKTVRDYTLGTALILGADPDCYSGMIRGLKNASLAGCEERPKNVTDAYNYLSKWEGNDSHTCAPPDYEGLAFTHDTRKPQAWHAKMTCRNCKRKLSYCILL